MSMNYDASPFAAQNAAGTVHHDSFLIQSSACLEDYRITAAEKESRSIKAMEVKVKSMSGDLNRSPDILQNSSAGLQTNPTFVSVHHADAEDVQNHL